VTTISSTPVVGAGVGAVSAVAGVAAAAVASCANAGVAIKQAAITASEQVE